MPRSLAGHAAAFERIRQLKSTQEAIQQLDPSLDGFERFQKLVSGVYRIRREVGVIRKEISERNTPLTPILDDSDLEEIAHYKVAMLISAVIHGEIQG